MKMAKNMLLVVIVIMHLIMMRHVQKIGWRDARQVGRQSTDLVYD